MLVRTEAFRKKGIGGSSFTPADIANLTFWYDIETSTLTDEGGGEISQINDLSGNDENAVQATSTDRAFLVANEFGTLDALDFISSDFYTCGSDTISAAGTFFVAAKADALHLGMLIGNGAYNNETAGAMIRVLESGSAQLVVGNGTSRASSSVTSAYSAGSVICAIGRWAATTVDININGTAGAQASSSGSLGSLATRIGFTTFNSFNGKIGAAGRYSVRISDGDTASLMTYLQGRFA